MSLLSGVGATYDQGAARRHRKGGSKVLRRWSVASRNSSATVRYAGRRESRGDVVELEP
jgi:hypothetical protein